MTRMTNLIALLAVLACSPVLTADAQEPSLKAGDYTLKMNIKEMGERGKQSKSVKVMIKAGSITVRIEGIASEMSGAVGKDGILRLGTTTIERNRIDLFITSAISPATQQVATSTSLATESQLSMEHGNSFSENNAGNRLKRDRGNKLNSSNKLRKHASMNACGILSTVLAITLTLSHELNAETPVEAASGERLSVEERAALADLDSSDRFRNIAQETKRLSAERARVYVEYTERRSRSLYGLTRLELSNVSEISDEVAKELAKHRGWLFLNGLTSISDEAAKALSQHHGRLYLNGLKTLSDEAAKSLAKHGLVPHRENDRIVKRGGLHLDGLTTLSGEAARALAQQKGDLWLRGLTKLSDEAVAVLRGKQDVRLPVKFEAELNEASNSGRPSHRTYVYAKIFLPMKVPDKAKHPVVESWIAKKLRKRGKTELRAVTDWVRLGEGGEHSASIWNATVDGKGWGCPVAGSVAERTADGKVKVELSGWSPFGAKIEGNSLSGESGSRGIATVDIGSNDQDGRAFVAFVIGPGKATHDQMLDAIIPGGKSEK